MNSALALSASLATLDQHALRGLIRSRHISSPRSIDDPLSLALSLLRQESIVRALQHLSRTQLQAIQELANGGLPDESLILALRGLGLVGLDPATGDPVSLDEVASELHGLVLDHNLDLDATHPPRSPVDTSPWFAQALTSVRLAAAMLRALERHPLKLGRRGSPTVVGVRELANQVHADQAATDRLLNLLDEAGMFAQTSGYRGVDLLVPSEHGLEWLALGYPDRWLTLATRVASSHEEHLLEQVDYDLALLATRLPYEFPLLPESAHASVATHIALTDDLGLSVSGRLTPVAIHLLHDEAELARELATAEIPPPVPGVYVQPDLSLIVPGPLAPEDESALSKFTEVEQLGPAATMRISAFTLSRAVRSGIEPGEIRTLLQRLSLTGVPQPLEFLLTELERRPPLRAEATPPWVRSPRTTRNYALSDATVAELADRVLAASQSTEHGYLSRQLEMAIRDRSEVLVTAQAGSDVREFLLLPVSLHAGRLRASDQQAGVERTLPVSAITEVRAA